MALQVTNQTLAGDSSCYWTIRPAIPQPDIPRLYEDSLVTSLRPEEIIKRLERELPEIRDLCASPKPHGTENYFDMFHAGICESNHALRLEKEALEKEGLTVETMTIDFWHRHELPLALIFVLRFKFQFLNILSQFGWVDYEDRGEELKEKAPPTKEEQFQLLLYRLVKASDNLQLDDIQTTYGNTSLGALYPLLNKAEIGYALVFVMYLIGRSSLACGSIERMKQWVKERIAKKDISLISRDIGRLMYPWDDLDQQASIKRARIDMVPGAAESSGNIVSSPLEGQPRPIREQDRVEEQKWILHVEAARKEEEEHKLELLMLINHTGSPSWED